MCDFFFLLLNFVGLIKHFGPIGILSVVAEAKPIVVCSEMHTEYTNTFRGHNVRFFYC